MPACSASAGSCPMASSTASPFQSRIQMGMEMSAESQKPWRTVRRTSRTEWRLRPSSAATIGEVASARPRPKMSGAK